MVTIVKWSVLLLVRCMAACIWGPTLPNHLSGSPGLVNEKTSKGSANSNNF